MGFGQIFQVDRVFHETAKTFSQFFGGHGIQDHTKAEAGFGICLLGNDFATIPG
jgi:hypothetical protein